MKKMTEGSIAKHLIAYAIPMIFGNILQLTYNAVDSIIIGKFLGENSLAAVSTSNPVMTIMILGASGIGIGASVLISRFYGASDTENLKREFSTTLIFSLFFSLLIFAAGFLLSPNILRWINTPEEAFAEANVYLRIIFVGFLFTFQYNVLSSALRAIGDSKTPVYFLSISCVINIVLDYLLVAVIPMGVAGAALATVIAEVVSVICCICWIRRRIPALWLSRPEYVLDRELLKETLKIGSLSALQQAAQPIGKVLIQSVINAQGIIAIGAFNAVCRVDDFACVPAQSIGSSIMTCTAQNRGAKQHDRVRETLKKGLLVAVGYFPIIFTAAMLLKYPVMKLMTPEGSTEMILTGAGYLNVKAWFFVMPCITNAIQGYFRGMGKMHIVLASTVIQISIRTLMVFLLVPRIGITGEAYACFVGWFCMCVFEFGYYFLLNRKSTK